MMMGEMGAGNGRQNSIFWRLIMGLGGYFIKKSVVSNLDLHNFIQIRHYGLPTERVLYLHLKCIGGLFLTMYDKDLPGSNLNVAHPMQQFALVTMRRQAMQDLNMRLDRIIFAVNFYLVRPLHQLSSPGSLSLIPNQQNGVLRIF